MQGNLTYKIPGEEERNMVNGRQKQNKHRCLNWGGKKKKKKKAVVAHMEKHKYGIHEKEQWNFKNWYFIEEIQQKKASSPSYKTSVRTN